MRPSWDATFIEMAQVIAKRSLCTKRQVGALIVGPDNRVIAAGYNGPPADFETFDRDCDAWCPQQMYGDSACFSVHAEMNALMYSDRVTRLGGTIYITCPPCLKCAVAIANSGLARVRYIPEATDHADLAQRLLTSQLLNGACIDYEGIYLP